MSIEKTAEDLLQDWPGTSLLEAVRTLYGYDDSINGSNYLDYHLIKTEERLKDKYGFAVGAWPRTPLDHPNSRFSVLQPFGAIFGIETLENQLDMYPLQYLQNCGIRQMRVVRDLVILKNEYIDEPTRVGGISFDSGDVYIDFPDEPDVFQVFPVKSTIHHELQHRADQEFLRRYERLGQFGKKMKQAWNWNWGRLNHYSERDYLRKEFWEMSQEERDSIEGYGFTRGYGMVDELEDRATIAEHLMMYPRTSKNLAHWSPVLYGKFRRIVHDMERRSGGLMDRRYFGDLLAGRVWNGYWEYKINNTKFPLNPTPL